MAIKCTRSPAASDISLLENRFFFLAVLVVCIFLGFSTIFVSLFSIFFFSPAIFFNTFWNSSGGWLCIFLYVNFLSLLRQRFKPDLLGDIWSIYLIDLSIRRIIQIYVSHFRINARKMKWELSKRIKFHSPVFWVWMIRSKFSFDVYWFHNS